MKVSKFRKQLLAEKHNIYTRMRYYYLSISSHGISFMVLSTQRKYPLSSDPPKTSNIH